MKKLLTACFFIIFTFSARTGSALDWDINSVFDEPLQGSFSGETAGVELAGDDTETNPDFTVKDMIKQPGFYFDAGFNFSLGLAPGWYKHPWSEDSDKNRYYLDRLLRMRGSFCIDAQISPVFRVKSSIYFEIPGYKFVVEDFFFDYDLYDAVFFRGGKYNLTWGISPNYGFTNLLSRVPASAPDEAGEEESHNENRYSGDSLIFKADIPLGSGGIQVLTLTRVNLIQNAVDLKFKDFGFGGKYNLAISLFDFDLGVFYQQGMAFRSFLSVKTTLWETELYNEYLLAMNFNKPFNAGWAANFGFMRDFFNDKLKVNAELLYNTEKDTSYYLPETSLRDAATYPLIDGLGLAVNLLYKPWEKMNLRFFFRTLYAPLQNSAQLIPGFSLSPWPHIEFYFAVPMSLGSKRGYYYSNTFTVTNDNKPLPFALVFLVTLNGNFRFQHIF